MPRDFYTWMPLDLPSLPSVRRIRRKHGARGVLMYYELRIMVAAAIQYKQHVEISDVLACAGDWDMEEEDVEACLAELAEVRLIDASMLQEGLVGIEDVAERALYLEQKAEAGRKGGKISKRRPAKEAEKAGA